ncbi:hypothetical protein EIP86_001181 [Pleurotus ostreatoroseus]|nr:hypothetical protein EIP86_001181 [Pleurotus ostreatoroseus]
MLKTFKSPFDATVVRLLYEAKAEIVGKANCDEFGMGSLNVYSVHGPTVNPYQPASSSAPWIDRERRSAGGSSGGSAAAVSAGMCHVWGVVSYADSLDCVGIIGANVDYIKRTFEVLAKRDDKDPTAASQQTKDTATSMCLERTQQWDFGNSLKGLRIGIPQEYFPAEVDHSILAPLRRVVEACEQRGATIVPVSLPSTPYALSAYYVIASAEASSNLARYDGIEYGLRVDPPLGADKTKTARVYAHSRSAGFGPEVQRRILLGTYALTADAFDNYFLQAQRVRTLIRNDFDRVFRAANVLSLPDTSPPKASGVDVLMHPSAIRTAPPLPDPSSDVNVPNDSLTAYVQDVLTVPASLAGLPAMSVPAGLGEDEWPVGVSVVGQWGCDEMVLKVGKAIESLGI